MALAALLGDPLYLGLQLGLLLQLLLLLVGQRDLDRLLGFLLLILVIVVIAILCG